MFTKTHTLHFLVSVLLVGVSSVVCAQNAFDYATRPPFVSDASDPLVVINLSSEKTIQGESYTDGKQVYAGGTLCTGRRNFSGTKVGVCYTSKETYLGYFHPKKCYTYQKGVDSDGNSENGYTTSHIEQSAGTDLTRVPRRTTEYFKPTGLVSDDGSCAGAEEFNGSFMNWATMTALDQFRYATTGGARLVDTIGANAQTLLTRAHRYSIGSSPTPDEKHRPFIVKHINTQGAFPGFETDPASVTPFSSPAFLPDDNSRVGDDFTRTTRLQIVNERQVFGNRVRFERATQEVRYHPREPSQSFPPTVTGATTTIVQIQDFGDISRTITRTTTILGEYSVIVEVCSPHSPTQPMLEENCRQYSDGTNVWYKPEGVLQRNSDNIRFALLSYSSTPPDQRDYRDGGVLRANAKYIGPLLPTEEGEQDVNPHAETNEYGQQVFDPDCIATSTTTAGHRCSTNPSSGESISLAATALSPGDGVENSGIINYINNFGLAADGYKVLDPVAELYYEGFRYIATEFDRSNTGDDGETGELGEKTGIGDRKPVPEYYQAGRGLTQLSGAAKDNFPVIVEWDDPVLNQCQVNYMITVADQFAWNDNSLPHSSIVGRKGNVLSAEGTYPRMNVTELTNRVGELENITGPLPLGEVVNDQRDNSTFYTAGLAYFANTSDIRSDHKGVQKIKSFFVDIQEFNDKQPAREDNFLWLAAKYGGFEAGEIPEDKGQSNLNPNRPDPNNGKKPTEVNDREPTIRECSSNQSWDADGDCEPDTYTLASQPEQLISGINSAFDVISEDVSAGSAASISTNSSAGEGAVVQALFKASLSRGSKKIEWVGILRSLFIDEHGNFREDTDSNAQLTDADTVIRFRTETSNGNNEKAVVDRYITEDGGETLSDEPIEQGVEIDDLDDLWNARDVLAELDNDKVAEQRSYTQNASIGRFIFTAIDGARSSNGGDLENNPADGLLEQKDTLSFERDNFSVGASDNYRYLGLRSADISFLTEEAPDLVDFIRGKEGIEGARSRTIDYDGDGNDEAWRLGDTISSSPALVAQPNTPYEQIYGDATYAAFQEHYASRRHVVYAGANDGMLHAFNAGFYDAEQKQFNLSGKNSEEEHPLGAELWAYVPHNLLPHLQWLKDINYPHVAYVDGIPQVYDVNIFDDDEDHPGGWGTILVVGLGFGGGDFPLDADGSSSNGRETTTHSSYIVMDVTNPEKPPQLVAEITNENMGYTTSRPALIKNRDVDGLTNNWYLVFGSGPYGSDKNRQKEALKSAVSDQTGRLFIFDLKEKEFVKATGTSGNSYLEVVGAATDGFIGDLSSVDWNTDYVDDAVYFGTIRGSIDSPEGDLMRLSLNFDGSGQLAVDNSDISRVLSKTGADTDSINRPFTGPPLPYRDGNGEFWVAAGSGRFFVVDDALVHSQQGYYGVKEQVNDNGRPVGNTAAFNDLLDVSLLVIKETGAVKQQNGDTQGDPPEGLETAAKLEAEVESRGGWYQEFASDLSRNVGRSALTVGDQEKQAIVFTEYTPGEGVCDASGKTALFIVNADTGVSSSYQGLILNGSRSNREAFAAGLVRDIGVNTDQQYASSIPLDKLKLQDSTGRIHMFEEDGNGGGGGVGGRISWREILIE